MKRQVRICCGAVAVALFGFVLAACGTSQSGTTATSVAGSATATCAPSRAITSVTGTVRSLTASTLTIAGANGTTSVVNLTSTTRLTKIVDVTPASLVSGTRVQVTTDPTVTTAQRIAILSQNQGSFGGRGTSAGTPPAGSNASCFRNRGQIQGQSHGQGSSQGLRGTVNSVTSTKLVVDDAQGQSFTVAIGPSTVIVSTETAQPSDLTTGATVTAMATGSGTTLTARTITIQLAH